MLALALAASLSGARDAAAHESASYTRPFYRERYLICGRAPVEHLHCVGPIRARARLLSALAFPPGDPSSDAIDRARDAAVDAVYFHLREAVPALRILLQPLSPAAAPAGARPAHSRQALRAEAAYALAHLGDAASAPEIAALVADLEQHGGGSLWRDTLAALAVLDPAAASRYAIGFLGRASDLRTSMPGGSDKLEALAHLRAEDRAAALPVLERLAKAEERGYAPAHCKLMAARVRLDGRLRDAVRRQLAAPYSGTWLAGCAEAVISQLGVDPEDATALVRHLGRDDRGMDAGVANIAYTRILELIAAMDAQSAGGAAGGPRAIDAERIRRARAELRRGLEERSRWPHVTSPGHANYALHYVVLHTAALAGLGDAAARAKLLALVDDAADKSGAAWLAAHWALRLGLPGAADRAGALVQRGTGYVNSERRGFLYQGIRARVLAAYADRHPDDARWTALLLDADRNSLASEQALYRLSRRPPPGACDEVTTAARTARPEAVEHALLALAGLGAACRPQLERLAADTGATPEARGAALELAAALDAPGICRLLERAPRESVKRPAVERAALLAPACAGPRPSPRP